MKWNINQTAKSINGYRLGDEYNCALRVFGQEFVKLCTQQSIVSQVRETINAFSASNLDMNKNAVY